MTFSFWDMTSLTISRNSSGIRIWRHILRVTVTSFINRFPKFFFVILQITIPLRRNNYFCSTTYSDRETMVASCAPYPQCYLRTAHWASLWRHFSANFKNYFFIVQKMSIAFRTYQFYCSTTSSSRVSRGWGTICPLLSVNVSFWACPE